MTVEWISHRGYCANALENTIDSFRAAVELGFKTIETDLRVSGDGELVLCHDPDSLRLGGTSVSIDKLSRDQLSRITLSGGGRLLFLDEFFSEFSHLNWVLDIKPETGLKTIDSLLIFMKKRSERPWREQTRFLLWNSQQQSYLEKQFSGARFYGRQGEC